MSIWFGSTSSLEIGEDWNWAVCCADQCQSKIRKLGRIKMDLLMTLLFQIWLHSSKEELQSEFWSTCLNRIVKPGDHNWIILWILVIRKSRFSGSCILLFHWTLPKRWSNSSKKNSRSQRRGRKKKVIRFRDWGALFRLSWPVLLRFAAAMPKSATRKRGRAGVGHSETQRKRAKKEQQEDLDDEVQLCSS